MKKILKWTGITLLILIVLAIAAPFIFKDKIIQKVKDEANKNLNAKLNFGDFDISIIRSFPDLKVNMENLTIIGIKEFEGDTLINLQSLDINLDIKSVIQGTQYVIHDIILNSPRIHAIVLKDGKANWDITKPSAEAQPAESQPFKMTLKKFEINDGVIYYDDKQSNMGAEIHDLDHTLKGDFEDDFFELETKTTIASLTYVMDGVKYLSKVKTEANANMDVDNKNSKYTFKDNEFKLNELTLKMDGWLSMPNETDMVMDLKFGALQTDFKNFLSLVPGIYTKDFADVKTSGKLGFDGYAKGTYNEKVMPAFGIKLLVNNAMFKYPSLPKAVTNINADISVNNKDGQPDNTVTNIKSFHMEMGPNPVDISMLITTPVSDPNLNGKIKGKVDLKSVKEFIPLEAGQELDGVIISDIEMNGRMSYIDKGQYEKFMAKGQFIVMDMNYKDKETPYPVLIKNLHLNFTPQFVELANFNAMLGKSDMQATGRLDNFIAYALRDELLKGSLNLNSNYMNLNELMGEEESAEAAADTATGVTEVPSNIDFTLNSYFGTLIYDNMEMKGVAGTVIVKDSKADMRNLKMNMLDGSMVVNGSYDTKNVKKPKVSFDLAIENFDVAKTFKTFNTVEKLAPVAKYASGKFSTVLKFSSDLDQKMEAVLPTLNGYGKLVTKSIIISGFQPLNKVAEMIKTDKYKSLPLNNTNISFSFKDGRVAVEPFDIKVGNSSITMGGTNGFDQTIDYSMKFDVPTSELPGSATSAITSALGKANSKGANLSLGEKVQFAALIGGTVTNPTVKLDMKDAAKGLQDNLKNAAQAELDKQKAAAEAKAREELDKAKQQTEDRAKQEADKAKAEAERIKKEAEAKAKAEADKQKKAAEEKAKNEAQKQLNNIFKKK